MKSTDSKNMTVNMVLSKFITQLQEKTVKPEEKMRFCCNVRDEDAYLLLGGEGFDEF